MRIHVFHDKAKGHFQNLQDVLANRE